MGYQITLSVAFSMYKSMYNIMFFSNQVFVGNIDTHSIKKQTLPTPIEATFVRIYPQEFVDWMCMRVELYGKGMYLPVFIARNNYSRTLTNWKLKKAKKKKHVP